MTIVPKIVSVIIPVYNREHTIVRAIQSVLAQTFNDFELIIVDDASTDSTFSIIKTISDSDPRVKTIQHATNLGAAAARNTGIKSASSEYIAFLDSDDVWDPKKLDRQLYCIKNQNNQGNQSNRSNQSNGSTAKAEVICTGFVIHIIDDGKIIYNNLAHHFDINETIYEGCDLSPGSTMLAHRSVFDKAGLFDEELPRLEDWDWLLRYRQFGEITLLHEFLATIYNKRGREGIALLKSVPRFIKNNERFLHSKGFFRKREILANVWLQAAGTLLRERIMRLAFKALLNAFCLDPLVFFKHGLRQFKNRFKVSSYA